MRMIQPSTVQNTGLAERYSAARSALSKADPVMAQLIEEHPDFDPRAFLAQLPKMDAFGTLLFQIIGQQLSVFATRAILTRLQALFGGRLPTPLELIDIGAEQVHAAGLSKRKVETMRALAQAFVDGDLDDDTLAVASDAEIEAKLTAISGIGPWTVNVFLLIALDRPDVFPAGDLALRRAVKRLYGLDQLPSESELLGLAERWRPYRSLAAAYLFDSEFG
jgi:DNA-3-methyladenine glycosylase II